MKEKGSENDEANENENEKPNHKNRKLETESKKSLKKMVFTVEQRRKRETK